mgnify:CR=1 FL=1
MRLPGLRSAGYTTLLVASFLTAVAAGYSALGRQVDGDVYDFLVRLRPVKWQPESVVVAIDEAALLPPGEGIRGLRRLLAQILEKLAAADPKVVVVDLTLADAGDSADDARLAAAMRQTPNLVLGTEMMPDGSAWQDPLPSLRQWAAALGHVHAEPDPLDGVARQAPLEKVAGRDRRWALALEAYRLSRGMDAVVESPSDLTIGDTRIPAARDEARSIYIRFLPPGPAGEPGIPRIPARLVLTNGGSAAQIKGKVVFIGVTAQSAARDRLVTPYGSNRPMPGVEIHANVYETLAHGGFVRQAGNLDVLLVCAAFVALAGIVFLVLAGASAYVAGGAILAMALFLPYALYRQEIVFPFTAPVFAAWLSVAGAASYQHFTARRRLRRAEAEKARYQQAVHFVTHEMRTPLTAIQGSSELMSRYNLGEEKRKQIADLIHSESRRLAKMVETFLNVERLSAGQMELKKQPVRVGELVDTCLGRVQPLAEKKGITVSCRPAAEFVLAGDRELLEYALYNLLTNAIKYSPSGTAVTVEAGQDGKAMRLAVRDQGIGMDEKEMKSLFRKFYRTRRAVESGESGIGIGLSIVNEIVIHHGGTVEVASTPGQGSCFTLVFPAESGTGKN